MSELCLSTGRFRHPNGGLERRDQRLRCRAAQEVREIGLFIHLAAISGGLRTAAALHYSDGIFRCLIFRTYLRQAPKIMEMNAHVNMGPPNPPISLLTINL